MATTNLSAISNYTYTYNNQLQPKIDKNDDGTWNKTELQNYADAYKKATGTTLDVDKIVEKYANADGVIDAKGQEQMKKDDALGLSKLTGTSSSSSTSSTSSSSTSSTAKTMAADKKSAIYAAVNTYTYEYGGKLMPRLDKNDDGMWNKEELTNYANAYNKATGNKLDVDKLMEKYADKDGFIDPKNQAKMKEDDALGLSSLKTAYDNAKASTTTVEYNTAKSSLSSDYGKTSGKTNYSIEDIMGTLSSSGKMYFSVGVNKLDNMGSLLNAFNSASGATNNMFSSILSDWTSLSQYKTSSAYSAMSGQAMNFTL